MAPCPCTPRPGLEGPPPPPGQPSSSTPGRHLEEGRGKGGLSREPGSVRRAACICSRVILPRTLAANATFISISRCRKLRLEGGSRLVFYLEGGELGFQPRDFHGQRRGRRLGPTKQPERRPARRLVLSPQAQEHRCLDAAGSGGVWRPQLPVWCSPTSTAPARYTEGAQYLLTDALTDLHLLFQEVQPHTDDTWETQQAEDAGVFGVEKGGLGTGMGRTIC